MSDPAFLDAVTTVLKHEGGYVSDPDDPGGATNYGVSLRWLVSQGDIDLDGDGFNDFDFDKDGDVDADDIRAMNLKDAMEIYRRYWWDAYGYGQLPRLVGSKVFDLSVNMGPRQAHRLLQRAGRACGRDIAEDGILGPKTKGVITKLPPMMVVSANRSEAAGFYRVLIAQKPIFEKYRDGWLRRAYS